MASDKTAVTSQWAQDALSPLVGDGWVVGWVDEIHGERGQLVDAAVSKAEVETLVRHYFEEYESVVDEWVVCGSTGSHEMRMQQYAIQRIAAFVEAGLVSRGEVQRIEREVWEMHETWRKEGLATLERERKEEEAWFWSVAESLECRDDSIPYEFGPEGDADCA